jgi:AraC-like DNA-binding protein
VPRLNGRRLNRPDIEGFEYYPEGRLLEQFLDMRGRVGVAYERSIQYRKDAHTHDRLSAVFPRGSSVVEIRTDSDRKPGRQPFRIDGNHAMLVPRGCRHAHQGVSTVYDIFALFFDRRLVEEAGREAGLTPSGIKRLLDTPFKWRRTPLLDALVDRYFYCRVVQKTAGGYELPLLERQLVHEIVRQGCAGRETRRDPGLTDDATARAVRYIEANLFDLLEVDAIRRHAGISTATLFRHFRRELGLTPFEFIRNRRLDEAMGLLRGGRYPVGDVALLVGYEDFAAFSKAFKRRFKNCPSRYRKASNTDKKHSYTSRASVLDSHQESV